MRIHSVMSINDVKSIACWLSCVFASLIQSTGVWSRPRSATSTRTEYLWVWYETFNTGIAFSVLNCVMTSHRNKACRCGAHLGNLRENQESFSIWKDWGYHNNHSSPDQCLWNMMIFSYYQYAFEHMPVIRSNRKVKLDYITLCRIQISRHL